MMMMTHQSEEEESMALTSASPPLRRVFYFNCDEISTIEYSEGHVMRPVRIRLLNSLLSSTGISQKLTICHAKKADPEDLYSFHPPEFVHFLQHSKDICDVSDCSNCTVTTGSAQEHQQRMIARQMQSAFLPDSHIVKEDVPIFPEVWEVVSTYCGASIACAQCLMSGDADVAINWAGGMHHAHASRCYGFCYANDIVLCIEELLKKYMRVLYVDIDVHHGDGVEEAFAFSQRVMTLSVHQFSPGFFPGTGSLDDVGESDAQGFAVNVPLPPRVTDETYLVLFNLALQQCMSAFAPEAVVMQCGADSLFGDLIGRFLLSTHAHASCVEAVLRYQLPTVLLGGGGYNVFNTARCWAINTAAALGCTSQLPKYIPREDPYYVDYLKHQHPTDFEAPLLHVQPPVDLLKSTAMMMESNTSSAAAAGVGYNSAQLFLKVHQSMTLQLKRVRKLRQQFERTVFNDPERCLFARWVEQQLNPRPSRAQQMFPCAVTILGTANFRVAMGANNIQKGAQQKNSLIKEEKKTSEKIEEQETIVEQKPEALPKNLSLVKHSPRRIPIAAQVDPSRGGKQTEIEDDKVKQLNARRRQAAAPPSRNRIRQCRSDGTFKTSSSSTVVVNRGGKESSHQHQHRQHKNAVKNDRKANPKENRQRKSTGSTENRR